MLYADAFFFIAVYLVYGTLAAGYNEGWLALTGCPVMLAYLISILDHMSTQVGLVRTVYLRIIAVESSDITPPSRWGRSIFSFWPPPSPWSISM